MTDTILELATLVDMDPTPKNVNALLEALGRILAGKLVAKAVDEALEAEQEQGL